MSRAKQIYERYASRTTYTSAFHKLLQKQCLQLGTILIIQHKTHTFLTRTAIASTAQTKHLKIHTTEYA